MVTGIPGVPSGELQLGRGRVLTLDQPRIMGILNVTPDSFSDGGRHASANAAAAHARLMLDQGADIIDVGGESTRPGAQPVDDDEQCRRVIPAIEAITPLLADYAPHVAISIDTTSARVARQAADAGATILNDISAGAADPAMFTLAADTRLPLVLMHMQGTPQTMQQNPAYENVVEDVLAFLLQRAAAAQQAGVKAAQIVLDPGIGFGKTREHNLALLAHLDRFVATGYPVLLGTSRKRFMGSLSQASYQLRRDGQDASPSSLPPDALTGATCATTALGVAAGVQMFRVHDVQPNRQAADVAWALTQRA